MEKKVKYTKFLMNQVLLNQTGAKVLDLLVGLGIGVPDVVTEGSIFFLKRRNEKEEEGRTRGL